MTDTDPSQLIASLRQAGADRFEPVQFHYIETLARRATTQPGRAKPLLDAKLAQVLAAFCKRFALAQLDAKDAIAKAVQSHPAGAEELQRLAASGDFTGVRRVITTLKDGDGSTTLGGLAQSLAQQRLVPVDARQKGSVTSRPELKSTQFFRDTWSKISADKQVTQALDQAPKNAGPINSHRVVLRSLALMREVSPDYLNRFMSYVDALLSLEQGDRPTQSQTKVAMEGTKAKKIDGRRRAS